MDTIVISDDEEADTSIQLVGEYKPAKVDDDDLFFDPPSPRSPPPMISLSSPSPAPSSTVSRIKYESQTKDFLNTSSSQPPPIIAESPSPDLISSSQPAPLIFNSPSPPLIPDSPTSHRMPSPQPHSKSQKVYNISRGKAAVNKVAREELKQQKLREKEIERIRKEANRANTASKATQNCSAVVDRKILKLIGDEDEAHFTTLFEESALAYKITDHPEQDHSITWTFKRTEVENDSCVVTTKDIDLVLFVMEGSEYVRRILSYRDDPTHPQSLNNYICDIKNTFQSMIVILVFNLNNYLRTERAKEAKEYQKKFKERFESAGGKTNMDNEPQMISNIGPNDLQDLRLTLLIDLHHRHQDLKVHIEFREKTQEVVDSVVKYTKSAAGREIKKKERAVTNLDWAINMDKDKAIDPTRSTEDLTKLWIAQLQQFSQITLPIAKTIASEYPSPSALLDQYESLTVSEAQDLLAELHVQRNLRRQVGQNISRRIYRFLTGEDPDVHIGFD